MKPAQIEALAGTGLLVFSALLCGAGALLLALWVNTLTLWLTLATFIGYAVIYTVVLKPLTPQNIVIGGASGAMPPLLGWAAMRGDVGPEALILFRSELADEIAVRRKRAGHLLSKGRFLAAQILALLEDDLWLDNARAANAAIIRTPSCPPLFRCG